MSDLVATPAQLTAKQRQLAALELRQRGHTYAQIADRLGYKTHSGAANAVYRALQALTDMTATAAKNLRTAEHERILAEIQHIHKTRDIALSSHDRYPDDPRWLMLVLQTTDKMLQASELIIRLYALDQIPLDDDADRPPITIIRSIVPTAVLAASNDPLPNQ